jgi:hypothetical protein
MVFETERSLAFVASEVINRAFAESLPDFRVLSIDVGDEFRAEGAFTVQITFINPQGVTDTASVPLSVDTFAVGGF